MLNIISNRLPVSVSKRREELLYTPSTGGLATGLASLSRGETRWIGWPGIASENLTPGQKADIEKALGRQNNVPLFLSRSDVKQYYQGFCNQTVWPLFHYFQTYTRYDDACWEAYRRVNQAFCDAVIENCSSDDPIWIHDYHLMLLPGMLRKAWPNARIGFFLHIPFPSYEIFRLLPWRSEILRGLLGADLIGFHTFDYVRHFMSSLSRVENIHHRLDRVEVDGRSVKVEAFPMGIDYERFATAAETPDVAKRLAALRAKVGDLKVIVSIDRLDYTKGIPDRLRAFDSFLRQHPEYHEKVTLLLLAVPSRTGVGDYAELKQTLDRLVGRINGTHGTIGWVPVWYLYRSEPFERLMAMYRIADVALVTPLRDGMNLIAKEFVAAKTNSSGVLVLSEMAGAASELGEALIVNANDRQAVVDALQSALKMPEEERRERMRMMQDRLARNDVHQWADNFINTLMEPPEGSLSRQPVSCSPAIVDEILERHDRGNRNLLVFDCNDHIATALAQVDDGGHDRIRQYLRALAAKPTNEIVFISNLDRKSLDRWLGELDASLVAEHGAWIKEKHGHWQMVQPMRRGWKKTVMPILQMYTTRTPGSWIEERDFSLIWHFESGGTVATYDRKQELWQAVSDLTEHGSIEVIDHENAMEVVSSGVNKSHIARLWIGRHGWDFIMGISGGTSGDDLFHAFPEDSYSIHVGTGRTRARIRMDSVAELLAFLDRFASSERAAQL